MSGGQYGYFAYSHCAGRGRCFPFRGDGHHRTLAAGAPGRQQPEGSCAHPCWVFGDWRDLWTLHGGLWDPQDITVTSPCLLLARLSPAARRVWAGSSWLPHCCLPLLCFTPSCFWNVPSSTLCCFTLVSNTKFPFREAGTVSWEVRSFSLHKLEAVRVCVSGHPLNCRNLQLAGGSRTVFFKVSEVPAAEEKRGLCQVVPPQSSPF